MLASVLHSLSGPNRPASRPQRRGELHPKNSILGCFVKQRVIATPTYASIELSRYSFSALRFRRNDENYVSRDLQIIRCTPSTDKYTSEGR